MSLAIDVRTGRRDRDLKRRVHLRLLADAGVPGERHPSAPDELRHAIAELLRAEEPLLSAARHDVLVHELLDEVAGLGPLEPLFRDPEVTEVMVNGPHRVYVERAGALERVDAPLDADAILHLVERVIGPLGLRLDRASPMVDARLPDGSRLHAVIPPLAVDGPCVTVRRFAAGAVPIDAFAVSPGADAFLRWAIEHGSNVVVSGATAAGKTTLCNALAAAIPRDARVVTIEETAELRLPLPHVVRLEARAPNAEGAGGVGVRDLVRGALRMRPDRLVVGEVRGAEAFDLVQALNTGHDGSFTTVHANGVTAVLDRITALVMMAAVGIPARAALMQIADAVDVLVHVVRCGGSRRVQTIAEVRRTAAHVQVAPIFEHRDGRLVAVGRPRRPTRRPDAPAPHAEWFTC